MLSVFIFRLSVCGKIITMKKTSKFLLLLLLIHTLNLASPAKTTPGKVMKVSDGDTVVIQPEGGGLFYKCRLYGIDAPEIPHENKPGQPYGEESTKELKRLILGQDVSIEIRDRDKYGREVCVIRKDGSDVNLQMIKKGMAWAYVKYLKTPYASEYIDAEKEARGKGLGLWKQRNPLPPWEFRNGMR